MPFKWQVVTSHNNFKTIHFAISHSYQIRVNTVHSIKQNFLWYGRHILEDGFFQCWKWWWFVWIHFCLQKYPPKVNLRCESWKVISVKNWRITSFPPNADYSWYWTDTEISGGAIHNFIPSCINVAACSAYKICSSGMVLFCINAAYRSPIIEFF